jgi:RNA polymerase sporulation-specific sigma factor
MFIPLLGIAADFLYLILYIAGANSFPRPLSAAEERKNLELLRQGDKEARRILIEKNLRLVAHIIKKYYSTYKEQDDLISIGTIGLIKAIDSFKSEKETRLATYAARCIENEILMYFRSMKKTAAEVSMNEPIDTDKHGNTLTLMDIIACDDTILEDIDIKMKLERLSKLILKVLDEREKAVITYRYGIGGITPLTQRETAKKLDISRSYVSRIEKKALEQLRESLMNETK